MAAELRVRTLAGTLLLSVPRSTQTVVHLSDLIHDVNDVVCGQLANGITEDRLQLFLGERQLHDDMKIDTLWPEYGGDIELQLRIRRKTPEDVKQQAVILLQQFTISKDISILDSLASIDLLSSDQLQAVVEALFAQAVADPTHSESYADIVVLLRTRYPELLPEKIGQRRLTFYRMLLHHIQYQFDSCAFGESGNVRQNQKHFAIMKFIGNLFLKGLIGVSVTRQIIEDLIDLGDDAKSPNVHEVECGCVLLEIAGPALLVTRHGSILMRAFKHRLGDLAEEMPQHIQDHIQRIRKCRRGLVAAISPVTTKGLNTLKCRDK